MRRAILGNDLKCRRIYLSKYDCWKVPETVASHLKAAALLFHLKTNKAIHHQPEKSESLQFGVLCLNFPQLPLLPWRIIPFLQLLWHPKEKKIKEHWKSSLVSENFSLKIIKRLAEKRRKEYHSPAVCRVKHSYYKNHGWSSLPWKQFVFPTQSQNKREKQTAHRVEISIPVQIPEVH